MPGLSYFWLQPGGETFSNWLGSGADRPVHLTCMYEVTARFTQPYSSVCYLLCDWADGTSTRASAVVVGVNDVLTALHAVFDSQRGGWARSVTVVPGADTSPYSQPFGQFSQVGSFSGRAADWDFDHDGLLTAQESQGDLALLGMSVPIGQQTGWLPMIEMPNDFYGVMAGYPARGTGLMAESVYADSANLYGVYDIYDSLGSGASGGPLLYTADGVTSVAGVLSSGNTAGTHSTFAGLFGADTWNWLQAAMGANDALLGGMPGSSPEEGRTLYTGTAFADTFTGTGGRDLFWGHGGNDALDGAGGLDIAAYSGALSDYQVTVAAGSIEVNDLTPGRDGTDTLRNIERVEFADVGIAFDVEGSGGQAYRLYQTAFSRAPDPGGLGYHMQSLDDGHWLTTVAVSFIDSAEFAATYGALDSGQFLTLLYANALHRTPDAGGFDFFMANMSNGNYTRAEVVVTFSESQENKAALIGAMQEGMAYIGDPGQG
jgi:V8-like Glu-specific endopeptidase